MIGALIDGAIKRRKVVLGVAFVAAIFGLFSYLAMPRESQPDIDVPYISVVVPFPGVMNKATTGWSASAVCQAPRGLTA